MTNRIQDWGFLTLLFDKGMYYWSNLIRFKSDWVNMLENWPCDQVTWSFFQVSSRINLTTTSTTNTTPSGVATSLHFSVFFFFLRKWTMCIAILGGGRFFVLRNSLSRVNNGVSFLFMIEKLLKKTDHIYYFVKHVEF